MAITASNRNAVSNEETIFDAGYIHAKDASAALYYPSLMGNGWDDELLPSGD